MDQYLEAPTDKLGSRLWLLRRAKESPDTLARARHYAEEALAWLVADGAARSIETEAEWVRPGLLGLRVVILRADGSRFEQAFNYSMTG